MSQATVIPTAAQRLGIKARERVRKPGPPRPWRRLVTAVCYVAFAVMYAGPGAAGQWNAPGMLVALVCTAVAVMEIVYWVRRVESSPESQALTLAGIVGQLLLLVLW